jgi:uncharacterized membrane protein YuzA (DUF378 family)
MLGRKRGFAKLNGMDKAAGAMLGIGALNWGLVGLTNFDAIRAAFGRSILSRGIYALVGASGVYALVRGRALAKR